MTSTSPMDTITEIAPRLIELTATKRREQLRDALQAMGL
jgi:hypothetical protein